MFDFRFNRLGFFFVKSIIYVLYLCSQVKFIMKNFRLIMIPKIRGKSFDELFSFRILLLSIINDDAAERINRDIREYLICRKVFNEYRDARLLHIGSARLNN